MTQSQRYVSNELTHFVGRKEPTEADQYNLLIKILRNGWLTHAPHDDPLAPTRINLDLSKSIGDDEAVGYRVVCFCDIPEPDLAIHVKKYSKFGLAFKKPFLIDKGASPVFYVVKEGPVVPYTEMFNLAGFVEKMSSLKPLALHLESIISTRW